MKHLIRKLLYRFSSRLPCRIITRDGSPYLERYFLFQWFGLTAYLHRFVGADGDEEVHNHPWNSLAICLAGGYMEERVTGMCILQGWAYRLRAIRPGSFNRIRANDFHRIAATDPETWTLFIHGKTRLGWGFLHLDKNPLITNGAEVRFYQPYPLTNGSKWWLTAPLGRESSSRTPLFANPHHAPQQAACTSPDCQCPFDMGQDFFCLQGRPEPVDKQEILND